MFLIRRDLLLRKKPGHGRRHADNDDAPTLPPSHPRDAYHPQQPPDASSPWRPRLVTVIIFFLFFFLFVLLLTFPRRRQSSLVLLTLLFFLPLDAIFSFSTFTSYPRVLQCSIEYLTGRTSCSQLNVVALKERHRDWVLERGNEHGNIHVPGAPRILIVTSVISQFQSDRLTNLVDAHPEVIIFCRDPFYSSLPMYPFEFSENWYPRIPPWTIVYLIYWNLEWSVYFVSVHFTWVFSCSRALECKMPWMMMHKYNFMREHKMIGLSLCYIITISNNYYIYSKIIYSIEKNI